MAKSPQWRSTCGCVCGCGRRTKYSKCTYCIVGAHRLSEPEKAHLEYEQAEREAYTRTACTVCGKPAKSYELEPGTGRCSDCMP